MSVKFGETAWNADSANARQVSCNGENIRKIHLQWIGAAFANFECSYGGRRRDQSIDLLKTLAKSLRISSRTFCARK